MHYYIDDSKKKELSSKSCRILENEVQTPACLTKRQRATSRTANAKELAGCRPSAVPSAPL